MKSLGKKRKQIMPKKVIRNFKKKMHAKREYTIILQQLMLAWTIYI